MAPGMKIALAAALASVARSAPEADEVTTLPGWDSPLPSKWYSGYVNITSEDDISDTMMSHYMFIESEGNPATDPVILWSNGGPGASSLFGLLVELGPLLLNDQSMVGDAYEASGVPQFFYNPYGWTQVGSVLMFDWPPPVGFSYCNGDPTGDGNSCGAWDDNRTAAADFRALRGWFDELFPEYKTNDLYLTGESYAGVYIPKLAQQVLADNEASDDPLNLKGFAVGDACTGTEVLCGDNGLGPWWSVLFFYGHGQFSTKLYDEIVDTCGMESLKHNNPPQSEACDDLLTQMWVEVGGYYDYHLYDDCIYEDDIRRRRKLGLDPHHEQVRALKARNEARGKSVTMPGQAAGQPEDGLKQGHGKHAGGKHAGGEQEQLGGALNDYVCGGGTAQEVWADQQAVREALNVPVESNFFSGDNGDGMTYDVTEPNLMPFYENLAKNNPDVRVLVYNGDADPGINSFVSQNWTVALGLPETQSWRPWTLDGCKRMGGYVTRYEGDFDFLTIRGSGHMVPQFKPEPALELIQRWIANEDWQAYDADCTAPPSGPHVAGKMGAASELASVKAQMALLEKRAAELEHEL
mmetsp:Transcript_41795/g.111392  ORF Transcript_41795/g.111392 Transcript_41795/m.111392 type:complete len:580 (-) Transcript_41795:623-2362(-)